MYDGFDYDNVWFLDRNSEYPYPQLINNRQIKELVGIEITTLPDKTDYVALESFDASGLVVSAVYDDGSKKAIDDYQLSGFESAPGKNIITVTYEDYTETFTVNVYTHGDANLDGYVTISDVTATQRNLASLLEFSDIQVVVSDTNGDKKVDINDAYHLQKYLAGFEGVVLG